MLVAGILGRVGTLKRLHCDRTCQLRRCRSTASQLLVGEPRGMEQLDAEERLIFPSSPEEGVRGASPGCQQSASNRTSRSLASHVLALGASSVYLRRHAVKAGRARVQ